MEELENIDIPILYINLEHKTERNLKMINIFKQYNITNYTRINGFNGKENSNLIIPYKHMHPDGSKKQISLSEYGCMISHLACFKYFIDNLESETCIILEDDVTFEFSKYYTKSFNAYIEDIPSDYEIIQLCVMCDKRNFKYFQNPGKYLKHIPIFLGAGAYIITKKSAQKILNMFTCINNVWNFSLLDYGPVTDWFIYHHLNKVYSLPLVTTRSLNDSSINMNHFDWELKSKMFFKNLWERNLQQKRFFINNIPTIYYINHKKDIDKRQLIEKQFERYGITNYTRIEPYKEGEVIIIPGYNDEKDLRNILLVNLVKCMLKFIKETVNEKMLIIMEDNCSWDLVNYYQKPFMNYISIIKNLQYDFIKLLTNKNIEKLEIFKDTKYTYGGNYLITAQGITNFLQKIKITDNTYDLSLLEKEYNMNVWNIPLLTLQKPDRYQKK